GWIAKTELPVQVVRVARVEHPGQVRERPVLDHLADQLDPEPTAPVTAEDVDVGEIDERHPVRVRAGEADLARPVVEPDDARGGGEAASTPAPGVCGAARESVAQLEQTGRSLPGIVDVSGWRAAVPTRVGMRARVPGGRYALRSARSRKLPKYSYAAVITASAS